MEHGHLERKQQHKEAILQYINGNPQQFLALDTSSERRGRSSKAAINRRASSGGRIGPQQERSEMERAFGAGFYDGLTFGFGDELDAGLSALGAAFDDREMGDVYDPDLARAREEAAHLAELHSVAFNSGLVLGSVAQPLNYTGAGWAARGIGLAGRVGRAAAAGGMYGGLEGFAHSDGGLENRAAAASRGALWGAATGAATVGGLEGHIRGPEFSFGRNFRIAPFGNRTGKWENEVPHYHRRGPQLPDGRTVENQGITRHRPWQSSKGKPEKWWERF